MDKYWDAYIRSQNEALPDPEMFKDIAVGAHVERILTTANNYKEQDTHRVGRPEIGKPQIEVSGSTAIAEQCFDESTWAFEHAGQAVAPPPEAKSFALQLLLEKRDGSWLVVGEGGDEDGSLKC